MINQVGVILLAAGASQRMGCCKQLLPIHNEPAVRYCVKSILRAGIEDIVVVVGHDRWRVAAALDGLPVCLAVNDDVQSDMARSVEIGYNVLPQYATGVMVALADHPMVKTSTYRKLMKLHRIQPEAIHVPVFKGRGGHPSLFPSSLCEFFKTQMPLNRLLALHPDRVNRFDSVDAGVVYDMDTRRDYRRIMDLAGMDRAAAAVTA